MPNSGLKDLRDHFETLFRECEKSVGFACPGVDHGRIKDDSEIAMHNFKGNGFIDMPHIICGILSAPFINVGLYWKATHQNENRLRGFVITANNLIITKYFFVQDMFSSEHHHWFTTPFGSNFWHLWSRNYTYLLTVEFHSSKFWVHFKTFSRMLNESSQKLPFVCTKRFVTIHLLVSQLKFSLWHGQFGQKGKTKDWNMSQIRPLGNCGSWSRRPKECFWRIRAQYHPSQSDFVKKIKSNGCQRIIWPLYQRYLVLLTQDDSDWLRRLSNQSPFKRKIKFYFLFV